MLVAAEEQVARQCGAMGPLYFAGQLVASARNLAQMIMSQLAPL
jgi:hypothetical protein